VTTTRSRLLKVFGSYTVPQDGNWGFTVPLASCLLWLDNGEMANNNQWTKSDGGRMWGGDFPTKFSVNLTPEEADQLGQAARMCGVCKSDLIRTMIAFAHKRAAAILERYPDVGGHVAAHVRSPAFGFETLLWDLDNPRFAKWQKAIEDGRLTESIRGAKGPE
jgi:hypothetical protein